MQENFSALHQNQCDYIRQIHSDGYVIVAVSSKESNACQSLYAPCVHRLNVCTITMLGSPTPLFCTSCVGVAYESPFCTH